MESRDSLDIGLKTCLILPWEMRRKEGSACPASGLLPHSHRMRALPYEVERSGKIRGWGNPGSLDGDFFCCWHLGGSSWRCLGGRCALSTSSPICNGPFVARALSLGFARRIWPAKETKLVIPFHLPHVMAYAASWSICSEKGQGWCLFCRSSSLV